MGALTEPARKPISAVGERYWDNVNLITSPPTLEDIRYLHVLFAHTGMPYKEVAFGQGYTRRNGSVHLGLSPGYLMNPRTRRLEMQGLPYGPLPRLLMLYICHEGKRWNNPLVDMNRSMSSFLREDLLASSTGGGPRGALTSLKRQMNRVAATNITIGMPFIRDGHSGVSTVRPTPAIIEYRVWDDEHQKNALLWNTTVRMSNEFFEGVINHSVPLDSRAVQALKSSAMCLDIYFNLAQRLHRIPRGRVDRVTWIQLWGQFGQDYAELKRFKFAFCGNLKRVRRLYPEANITEVEDGIELRYSSPPIPRVMSARRRFAQGNLDFHADLGTKEK